MLGYIWYSGNLPEEIGPKNGNGTRNGSEKRSGTNFRDFLWLFRNMNCEYLSKQFILHNVRI